MALKEVHTDIEIEASPLRVWDALTDLDRYPDWNPHVSRASGEVSVGHRLTLRMTLPGRRPFTIRPKVLVATPGEELRLLGSVPGISWIFSGEHFFTVSGLDGAARTRLVQGEIYRGGIVPLLCRTIARARQEFEEHNHALKHWVETGRRA